jgi:hypothetical protein
MQSQNRSEGYRRAVVHSSVAFWLLVAATSSVRAAPLKVLVPPMSPAEMAHRIITPHMSGRSPGSDARRFEVFKENLRRFAQGKPLINGVDKQLGY